MSSKIAITVSGIWMSLGSFSLWIKERAGSGVHLYLILVVLTCSACSLIPLTGVGASPTSAASSPTQTASPQTGMTPGATPPARADLSDVHAIARQIYAAVQAGQDLAPLLSGIFASFGVPVLNEQADRDRGLAMIKAGQPAVFDVQLTTIGQGFTNGVLINLDSLMADFSAHGVQATSPAGPLTAAYLKNALLDLTTKTSYTPQETLAALIIALGQERVRSSGQKNSDPVWADGYLDPLQYMLLVYGVSFTGLQSLALTSPGRQELPALTRGLPAGIFTPLKHDFAQESPSLFEKLLKALDPTNIPGYVICGLYLVENSQFSMQIEPAAVYHKQTDVSSPPPYQATITGSLFMTSDPSPRLRDLLIAAGCKAPPNKGPLPGKTIGWTLDSVAQQHGSLNNPETKTKEDGTVRAVYETVAEKIPAPGRLPPALQQVQGEIQATVLDLVDGHENLEAVIRLAGGGEKAGWVYPDIKFYSTLVLDISGTFQLPGKDVTVTDVIANQTIPLTANNSGTLQGNASVPLTSSASLNCGSGGIVQGKGAFTGKFQVFVSPKGDPASGQLSVSFLPDLTMLKAPSVNIMCTAGDLNDVAWAGVAALLGAKVTFGPSNLTYSYTPPKATGAIIFTLRPVNP